VSPLAANRVGPGGCWRFSTEVFERDVARVRIPGASWGQNADYGRWDEHSEAWAVTSNRQAEVDLARLHEEFDYQPP